MKKNKQQKKLQNRKVSDYSEDDHNLRKKTRNTKVKYRHMSKWLEDEDDAYINISYQEE